VTMGLDASAHVGNDRLVTENPPVVPADEPPPEPPPSTGVVVATGYGGAAGRRGAVLARREQWRRLAARPAVVAGAALGTAVLVEALGVLARRVVGADAVGRRPVGDVTVSGFVLHRIDVVHHHVVHIVDGRSASLPHTAIDLRR